MIDLVTAVNEQIRFGNISAIFSPVSDENFLLGEDTKFLSESPREALRKGNFKKVSTLFSFVNNFDININICSSYENRFQF